MKITNKAAWTGIPARISEKCKQLLANSKQEYGVIRVKMKDLAKTNYELGMYHFYRGNVDDAKFRFRITRWINPNYWGGYYGMGLCLHYEYEQELLNPEEEKKNGLMEGLFKKKIDKKQDAIENLRKALSLNPDIEEAHYILAVLGQKVTPTRVPLRVIEIIFDAAAAGYNSDYVGRYNYRGHIHVFEAVNPLLPQGLSLSILDVGCGTGLCGQLFRENNTSTAGVIGVDISDAMLQQARELKFTYKPVYDALEKADYQAYLDERKGNARFTLIVAADSLQYQRELVGVLKQFREVLQSDGLIAFVVPQSAEGDVRFDAQQQSFSYSPAYVTAQVQQAGFVEKLQKTVPLYDGQEGYLVVATPAA